MTNKQRLRLLLLLQREHRQILHEMKLQGSLARPMILHRRAIRAGKR